MSKWDISDIGQLDGRRLPERRPDPRGRQLRRLRHRRLAHRPPGARRREVHAVPAVLDLLPRHLGHRRGREGHGFDLDHCKGCGMCANECPSDAITMVPEGCELIVEEELAMAEQRTVAVTGNVVVAEAFRQCAPDVVAAYPITPQTTIVEEFAKFVAQGRVHTEYVTVESEHSAMSACIGASAAGARVMTATSSQGLAYMWEMLGIASGMRLPIVMANANRALSAPINIHCDHSRHHVRP